MTKTEAIDRLRQLYSDANDENKAALEALIPELKDIEDTRIRKDIEKVVQDWWARFGCVRRGFSTKDEMLAWLEKQKEQKPAEWYPQPESLEALMYAVEGKWDMIKPTSYLSRKLEDLYEGLVNTFNVDETYLHKLSEIAYTADDIEGLKVLKDRIEASMEQPTNSVKPAEWSEEDERMRDKLIKFFEWPGNIRFQKEDCDAAKLWLKSLCPQPH